MKRLKQLLVIGLAVVMVFAFAACGKSSKTLSSIKVDTTAAKTEYTVGESFSSAGIIVTATYDDETTAEVTNYEVDSSAYDSSKAGTYSIGISYTENEVTKPTSYSVTVTAATSGEGDDGGDDQEETNEYYGGLEITKTTTEYTVESSNGVTVGTDDISVYIVDADTNVSDTALSSDSYTLKYYKIIDVTVIDVDNIVEIDSLSNLTEGKYEIWAYSTTNDENGNAYEVSDCVEIYVLDTVQSIALNNAETGTFTQSVSTTDSMSSTWTFTATYGSGATKELTASEVEISGVTTSVPTDAGKATISYSATNAKGEVDTVTCEVEYTVTSSSSSSTLNYSFSISELVEAIEARTGTTAADKTQLATTDFAGSNAFLTLLAEQSNNQYRTNNDGVIEIKDSGLSVTFMGTGTITISFASTGSTNVSSLALVDSEGNYVTGTTSDATIAYAEDGTTALGYYTVTGSSDYVTVTFTVSAAGTYTIATNVGSEGRGARIKTIEMTDIVEATTSAAESQLSISELVAAIEARTGTTAADKTQLATTDFAGSNAFLTLLTEQSSNQYRTSSNGVIEIKGDGLSVTFLGTGTITISFASTGSTNVSSLALKDSEGNYVTGTTSDATIAYAEDGTTALGYYTVTGSSDYVTVTFTITTAGTYIIATNVGDEGRGARIQSISMTDLY